MELRACIGADAARRAAERAGPAQRAEILARGEAIAAAQEPEARNVEYERLWDAIVDAAGNIAYRLALNTLVAGQHVLVLDAERVAAELGDADAIRALAGAIADGRPDAARAIAAELLERSA
jgi:DNA-binding FadR family transcriptional regulator